MAIEWLLSTPVVRIRSFHITTKCYSILYKLLAFFPTVNTPHFLTIKGVEVNAGQTASFHCTVNGRKRDNFRLWLQVRKRCCYLVFLHCRAKWENQSLGLFRNGASEMHICYLAGPSGLSIFSLIDDSFQTIKLNTGIKIL